MSESIEAPASGGDGRDAPTHFIIKVEHQGRTAYALCARVLLVEHSDILGISARSIDEFIERNPISGTPLLADVHMTGGIGGKMLGGIGGKMVDGMGGKNLDVTVDVSGNTVNVNNPPKHG